MTAARICIFAKPPVAGAAKTRLAAYVGAPRAAELARAFLRDTCAAVRALPWARPVLATAGELDAELTAEAAMPLWPQGDGDLGARLERVLARALDDTGLAIAIGTDSPGLPPQRFEDARRALATADAVIGPADDGGFYLLGLRRCPPGLLAELPWSAADTRARTIERLRAHGLSVAELAPWFDVDRAGDLARLHALLDTGAIVAPHTRRVLGAPRISVVVPVLDEARRIEGALDAVLALAGRKEVIVVDGGSRDDTARLARSRPVRVVEAERGRARQMNAGAAVAAGDVLVFLHADTTLPGDALARIEATLADPAVVAGAFRTWTVADTAAVPWFAPLLHLADLRSRYTSLPYGDQAVFVRAGAFRQIGGFPDQPLMEDLELARRLSRLGRIVTVPARVRVSGRRFVARPVFYTVAVNVFPTLYRLGVPPRPARAALPERARAMSVARFAIAALVFVVLTACERRWPLRPPSPRRGAGCGSTSRSPRSRSRRSPCSTRRSCCAPSPGPTAHDLGLLRWLGVPPALAMVLAVVLLDYTLWYWHWLNHRVGFLWRFHASHHADVDLDASTALRFHPGELVLSLPVRALQVIALGVAARPLVVWETLVLALTLFHHSNARLPVRLERVLGLLVITPRVHGIHHSRRPEELHRNFGTLASLWDRLHRTRVTGVAQDAIVIGLPGQAAAVLGVTESLALSVRREVPAR